MVRSSHPIVLDQRKAVYGNLHFCEIWGLTWLAREGTKSGCSELVHWYRIRVRAQSRGGGGIMSVENRSYYQVWFTYGTCQFKQAVVIHTFGGRGSPVESRLAA